MVSPQLSICIATVNRAAFIGKTLESIITQATDEVEIVIVDGASTDNTEEIVEHYRQQFPRLRYFRLDVKGGVDRDYCRAVDLAQGEYCWLFTDDDILKPGAIQAVLAAIRQSYGLIIINAEVRNADLSEVLADTRLKLSTNQVYRPVDCQRLFIDIADYLSFIGCVVIKRQLWNAREKERYFGTVFVHVGVIFQSPLPEDAIVIAEPLISIRYGNALWTPRSFEISLFKWSNLIWSFPDYPESAKLRVVPRELWRKPKTLLVFRARGNYSLQEYHNWLEPRLSSRLSRMVAKAIALFPGCVLNILLFIYFSIFYSQPGARLVDLQNSHFYYRHCLRELLSRVPRSSQKSR